MLSVLLAFLYVNVGFQLGKKAVKTWKKRDSKSLESFLLFPVSHARGKVGEDLALSFGINGGNTTFFRVLITLGWPVMVAWNAVLILGLLGPDKIIRRLTAGKPTWEQKIRRIKAEERKADRMLQQLLAGEGNEKRPRRRKDKALPAPVADPPPAAAPAPETASPPGVSLDLLETASPSPAAASEPSPSQVQVRVTVDVTAPGSAAEHADHGDEQPQSREAPLMAAASDRLVH